MLWKCCTQYASKFRKLRSGQRTAKVPFSFQSQKKGNAKERSKHCTIVLISHASKVMFKILQARLQARDQIANIQWIIEKAKEFQKNIYFCFIDYAKAFDCVDHNKLENSERNGTARPPDLPPDKSVCRSRSKLELDMEQQTGSKLGKDYIKVVYCHLAYLTYMQSRSFKIPGSMNHKLESRLMGEKSTASDMQIPL